MPRFYCLIGLPGSGKSDLAKSLEGEVISVSEIRRMTNDEKNVHDAVKNAVVQCLSEGKDCIYDAPNTIESTRQNLLRSVNVLRFDGGERCEKICIVVATPYDICKRNSYYPDAVSRHRKLWQTPGIWEGWDEIWLYYPRQEYQGIYGDPKKFHARYHKYDQKSGSKLSLGDHLAETGYKLSVAYNDSILTYAGLLHDCAKPFTQTFEGKKVRYYHHQNIGAYESFFFDYGYLEGGASGILYISSLICYHMCPFIWKDEAQEKVFAYHYGDKFYQDIMCLHKADLEAR